MIIKVLLIINSIILLASILLSKSDSEGLASITGASTDVFKERRKSKVEKNLFKVTVVTGIIELTIPVIAIVIS